MSVRAILVDSSSFVQLVKQAACTTCEPLVVNFFIMRRIWHFIPP